MNDGAAVAALFATARREHGMEPGAELETLEYWRDVEPVRRAMGNLKFLHELSLGTDVLGDIYEHILSKLSLAGQFGQFRTPRHIVDFMVSIADPQDGETVMDPACGTGGFLVAASAFRHKLERSGRYEGTEIDRTVARIAGANLTFHGVENGQIAIADGLAPTDRRADVILANPPFAGSVSDDVVQQFAVRSKKTELLFLERMCSLLRPGGRAVVVVPYGVVTGAAGAGSAIRSMLVRGNSLRAVVELPSGVFRPYTDVKTAILFWEAVPQGKATHMIRVDNDGLSLDQRRSPVAYNDLPEALAVLRGGQAEIAHRVVTTAELEASAMNLNPSRYLSASDAAARQHVDSEDVLDALQTRLVSMLDLVGRLHSKDSK
ncbi:HsdM family class I SAM-dependent methyltransferase [Clavibacter zhangzhiyongii]|uniref:HsdM family class I SAM-dependent methyltransferase n=1 Tax=Clavibacter zhangzhiyongii TaxID=2768071 RepID=UPI0039E071B1